MLPAPSAKQDSNSSNKITIARSAKMDSYKLMENVLLIMTMSHLNHPHQHQLNPSKTPIKLHHSPPNLRNQFSFPKWKNKEETKIIITVK